MEATKRNRGRPKEDYKHISPLTGKPIPATRYYKEVRAIKRQKIETKRNNQYTKGYQSQTLSELMTIRDMIEALIRKELALQSI